MAGMVITRRLRRAVSSLSVTVFSVMGVYNAFCSGLFLAVYIFGADAFLWSGGLFGLLCSLLLIVNLS